MKCINYLIMVSFLAACVGRRPREFGTSNKTPAENIAGQDEQMENPSLAGSNSVAGAAGMYENTAGLENNGGDFNQSGSAGTAGLEINHNAAGSNNFAGTGGSTGSAGNNSAGNSGGTSCIPLTCENFAKQFSNQKKYPSEINQNGINNYNSQTESLKACGEISDGCGKKINCNNCGSFEECSVPGTENRYSFHFTSNSGNFPKFQAVPLPENTCSGGCAFIPNKSCPISSLTGAQYKVFACLNKTIENLPESSCVEISNNSDYSEYFQSNLYYDSVTGYKIKPIPRLFCCKPND